MTRGCRRIDLVRLDLVTVIWLGRIGQDTDTIGYSKFVF